MPYYSRAIDYTLEQLLPFAPAIAIDGPKAVGKTATAATHSTHIYPLDDPTNRALLEADPTFSSFPDGTLLLDEWQIAPNIWNHVRRAVDAGASPARFLLTGSATPNVGAETHSGAGRILSLRMRPMALFERPSTPTPTVSIQALLNGNYSSNSITGHTDWTLSHYIDAITSSGFPGILQTPPVIRNQHLNSYITRILDRDLPDQGYTTRDRHTLLAWMRAYAAATSTTTNYSTILDAATGGEAHKPSKKTTLLYRAKLSSIWMLDPVPPWDYARGPLTRMTTSPKHQLTDPALALSLLDISPKALTHPRNSHLLGPLFESLATLTVRVAVEALFGRVGHFRTRGGEREIDLIATSSEGGILACEVKLSREVKDEDVQHLLWLRNKIPEDVVDTIIINTGPAAYRRPDGVAVVPLSLLGL